MSGTGESERRREEARSAVLGRVRSALARTPDEQARAEAAVAARLHEPEPGLLPARGQLGLEDRIALFTSQAQAVQAEVVRLAAPGEVAAVVSDYLRRRNLPQRVKAAPDPRLGLAGFEGQPLLRVESGGAAPADAVGLTVAAAGVAETGTLVLTSDPATPTLLAYLPETSIVLLPAAAVHGAYEQALRQVGAGAGRMPRSVNFITGPSRTGDIAQRIELGAHGPRNLLILIVDGLPEREPVQRPEAAEPVG